MFYKGVRSTAKPILWVVIPQCRLKLRYVTEYNIRSHYNQRGIESNPISRSRLSPERALGMDDLRDEDIAKNLVRIVSFSKQEFLVLLLPWFLSLREILSFRSWGISTLPNLKMVGRTEVEPVAHWWGVSYSICHAQEIWKKKQKGRRNQDGLENFADNRLMMWRLQEIFCFNGRALWHLS